MRVLPVAFVALMFAPVAAQTANTSQIPNLQTPIPPASASTTAPAWQTISGKDLGFTATFPGNATRKDDQRQTLFGPVARSTFTVAAGGNVFSVLQDDYSKTGGKADPQALVDSALNGALRNAGGTILSQGTIAVPGGAGREALISSNGMFARFRYTYVWPHLYQVTGVTRDKDGQRLLAAGDYARFFDGFRLASEKTAAVKK